jgi:hypothetical protein
MRISIAVFFMTLICTHSLAQTPPPDGSAAPNQTLPAQPQPSQTPPGQTLPGHTLPSQTPPGHITAAKDTANPPSGFLQPSLDTLLKAVGGLQLERWKKGSVRDEAGSNVSSIQRDLQSTLPPLLKEADAAPRSMSKVLPVSRNIDALYDVVLRVVDGARIAAPSDQFTQLQDAMTRLEKARHTLSDQMQETAAAQEKQIADLQVAIKAEQSKPPVVCSAPAVPAPTPAKKPAVKKRKPAAAKPTTAPPSGSTTPNSSNPPKPSNP